MASAQALTCIDLFRSDSAFQKLSQQTEFTETQLLNAAETDVLGAQSLSAKAKRWAQSYFAALRTHQSFRESLRVEIRRRDYQRALNEMGIESHSDLKSILKKYRPYISGVFALGINGAVNYLSYRYLSTYGYLVFLPSIRLFDPQQVPDEVLLELLSTNTSEDAPKTRTYIFARWRHGAQTIYDNVRKIFPITVLSTFAVFHAQLITDPGAYVGSQLDTASSGINMAAYKQNENTIYLLETKKKDFERLNEEDKVKMSNDLIIDLQSRNRRIISGPK